MKYTFLIRIQWYDPHLWIPRFFRASRIFSVWPEIPGKTLIEITETEYQFHTLFHISTAVSLQMFPLLKQGRENRSKVSIWLTYTRNHKSCQEQQAGHMVWCGNYSHRNSLSDWISCLNCEFIKQRDRAIDKTATKNSWDVKPNWRWKEKQKHWEKYKESLKYWGALAMTTMVATTRTAKKQ